MATLRPFRVHAATMIPASLAVVGGSLTKERTAMANKKHVALINQGVAVWNKWRSEHPRTRPDLLGANLFGANLCGADLREADLRGADLGYANLCGADLSYANLRGADLFWASLSEANLSHANLGYANLRGTDLMQLDLPPSGFAHHPGRIPARNPRTASRPA
jgi:uncharacterized protein YjbI with pentapeptide repeats